MGSAAISDSGISDVPVHFWASFDTVLAYTTRTIITWVHSHHLEHWVDDANRAPVLPGILECISFYTIFYAIGRKYLFYILGTLTCYLPCSLEPLPLRYRYHGPFCHRSTIPACIVSPTWDTVSTTTSTFHLSRVYYRFLGACSSFSVSAVPAAIPAISASWVGWLRSAM